MKVRVITLDNARQARILLMMLVATLVLLGMRPPALLAASDWTASYWNNTSMSGNPALQRSEATLNYDWGDGAPASGVNGDQFSARWERTINVSAGTYRFTATMDDGMRVWVDDTLIVNSWWDSQVHSMSGDIFLSNGDHRIRVEYYDAGGKAVAALSWSQISTASGPIYNWRGEYFNNMGLFGQPVLVRDDRGINFDWGGSAPEWNVVSADHFSVRWTRDVFLNAGRYRFTVQADDGVRLWVNGRLLVDQWHDGAATYYHAETDVPGGSIPIKMEYYENAGAAVARLAWHYLGSTSVSNWRGEYFNNSWLGGSPGLVRDDAAINFDWGFGSPGAGIANDNFSVRWTRDLSFAPGTYRFTTTSDDGVRLWVNGQLLIDQWRDQSASTYSKDIFLSGNATVRMEYYESGRLAIARLNWARIDHILPPPPLTSATIVDDADPGFVKGGSPTAWRSARQGHNGHLTWTLNNDRVRANYNWGHWTPQLLAGRYEVFVYVPAHFATTEGARYWVSHAGGYSLRVIDQAGNGGGWVSLGTYDFRGNNRDYVSLSDVTFEPLVSQLIVFDAIRWEPR